MALLAAGLLAGCAGPDENEIPGADRQPILLNAGIQQMTEGTRATTFDNATALQTEGSFTCVAYNANTTTEYISPTTVNWNSSTSQWEFNGGANHYYWPLPSTPGGTYPALDFFAYMPATKPDYITSGPTITNTSGTHTIAFGCDMSETVGKEFVFAMALDQNQTGTNTTTQPTAGQVDLSFKHPFAKVTFQKTDGATYTINSVSVSGSFKATGTCTYDGSTCMWTSLDGSVTPSFSFNTPVIAIPYDYGSFTVSANVSWTDWSNVSKTLSSSATFNLQAGHSYTYTISVTKDYALKVDTEKFTEQW